MCCFCQEQKKKRTKPKKKPKKKKMFDRRSNAKGPTLRCSGEGPILSCASKGTVLAVADGSEIWFFDCRNGRPLRKFDESHSDEISVLRFRDGADPILLSGGT